MVTCYFQGGLGNQIFQLVATYNLAKLNNDVPEYNLNESHTPNQGFIISKYKDNIFKEFKHTDQLTIENIFSQEGHCYKNIHYQPNLQIQGYFQSEKYFIENKNEIINKLLTGLYSYEKSKDVFDYVKNFNKPLVSVHIRRGDYLNFSHIHTPCSLEYYENALSTMKEKIGDFIPIFISDDKVWCNENFNSIISPFDDELMDLTLMTKCDHNIIANSSFSWWGAYLNQNNDKIVIGPKKWFGPGGPQNQEDTIPENWIKI
jgi:hypothetical protein